MLILDVQKVDKTMDTPQVMEDVLIDQHNVEVHQSEEPVKGRFAIIKRAIYNKLVSAWLVVAAIFSQSNVHKELKNEKEVECASLVVENANETTDNNNAVEIETNDIDPHADQKTHEGRDS